MVWALYLPQLARPEQSYWWWNILRVINILKATYTQLTHTPSFFFQTTILCRTYCSNARCFLLMQKQHLVKKFSTREAFSESVDHLCSNGGKVWKSDHSNKCKMFTMFTISCLIVSILLKNDVRINHTIYKLMAALRQEGVYGHQLFGINSYYWTSCQRFYTIFWSQTFLDIHQSTLPDLHYQDYKPFKTFKTYKSI